MIRRSVALTVLALAMYSAAALGPPFNASAAIGVGRNALPRHEQPPSSFIERGWLLSTSVDVLSFAATNAPRWVPDSVSYYILEAALGLLHISDGPTETLDSSAGEYLPATAARPRSASSFFSSMKNGIDWRLFKMVGPYANGYPFRNGWVPDLGFIGKDRKLTLQVKKRDFYDFSQTGGGNGRHYPYSAAEIRSRDYYGVGCYSVCMKPSRVSGVSSSFYAMSGAFDTPRDAGRHSNAQHNEIDIEFIGGKAPHMVQTNFFSRWKDPHANSASGHEQMHYLKFDATKRYASYSWKWTHAYIAFYADGRPIRQVWAHKQRIPSPSYSTMRIASNTWPVVARAEEWAGKLPKGLKHAEGKYSWFAFDKGLKCKTRKRC